MSNNVTVIPKKPARHSLLTSTKNIVYMPLASVDSHGIVKIGDGLSVTTDGLLSVNFNSDWFTQTHLNIENLRTDVDALDLTLNDVVNDLSDLNDQISDVVTNNTLIKGSYGGFKAGAGASGEGVAIGKNSTAGRTSVAVGEGAVAYTRGGTVIGTNAKSFGKNVQLGEGVNDADGTLQFRDFNIIGKDGKLYTNLGTETAVDMGLVASETYVKDLLKTVTGGGISLIVVDVLPTEDISTSAIYLVPRDDGTYDEYVYVNEKWEQIGTTDIDLSNYVTLEEYNKLVNNEVQINSASNGYFLAGGATGFNNANSIVIGKGARVGGSTANGVTAIGSESGGNSTNSTAIGRGAFAGANNSAQIGFGQNYTKNTLQFMSDNIYNAETHTATFQNIEQNGNKVYGVLTGTEAPTTETIGAVGQFYIDTTNSKAYQCMAVTTDETAGITTYTWQGLGGVSQEDFDKLVNNETQIKTSGNGFKAGGAQNVSSEGIAIGYNSYVFNAGGGIAIGKNARVLSGTSIQLGTGTNIVEKSLQIYDDNIYNYNTHTLTVQNIELNGENLADKLGGATITNINDTVTTAKLENVVNLSEAQYQQLVKNGSITIGEQTITYDENAIYITSENPTLNTLTLVGDSVLTSSEAFTSHVQILVEFETDSIHAGFDCVLHPYDEAVCFVTYDVLVNGQPNFGTAYLNESGNVVINVPSGLTFTNVHAKYVVYGG